MRIRHNGNWIEANRKQTKLYKNIQMLLNPSTSTRKHWFPIPSAPYSSGRLQHRKTVTSSEARAASNSFSRTFLQWEQYPGPLKGSHQKGEMPLSVKSGESQKNKTPADDDERKHLDMKSNMDFSECDYSMIASVLAILASRESSHLIWSRTHLLIFLASVSIVKYTIQSKLELNLNLEFQTFSSCEKNHVFSLEVWIEQNLHLSF